MVAANLMSFYAEIWPGANIAFGHTVTMNASARRIAWIFQAPYADTITTLGASSAALVGTCPTFRISLQGVDSSGQPDGTIKGGGSPASATFTTTANTWTWVTLSNSYTCSRGEMLSIVIDYSSGTIDGSNSLVFNGSILSLDARTTIPYAILDTAGSWAKQTIGAYVPSFGYKSATRVIGYPSTGNDARTVSSAGHRAALKFSLPASHLYKYSLIGARMCLNAITAARSVKFGLWNAAGTALQDLTLDTDHCSDVTTGGRTYRVYFDEATLATLSGGTTYYLGVENVDTNVILLCIRAAAAGDLDAWPGGSANYLSTWNGSAWTDVTTTRPFVVPILDTYANPALFGGGMNFGVS